MGTVKPGIFEDICNVRGKVIWRFGHRMEYTFFTQNKYWVFRVTQTKNKYYISINMYNFQGKLNYSDLRANSFSQTALFFIINYQWVEVPFSQKVKNFSSNFA